MQVMPGIGNPSTRLMKGVRDVGRVPHERNARETLVIVSGAAVC